MKKECTECNSFIDEEEIRTCESCGESFCKECINNFGMDGDWCDACEQASEDEKEHQREKMEWFNYGRHFN